MGRWEYPPLDAAMSAVVLKEVETYVLFHKNTIDQYIATCPILGICLTKEPRPGAWVTQRWWEQGGLDLVLGGWRTETREMEAGMEAGADMEEDEWMRDVE